MIGSYRRRIVDTELDDLMTGVAAISIDGPRAVGKTRTASMRAETTYRLDDPAQLRVALSDPSRLVRGRPPILIDEWQRMPYSWDLVRRSVDDDRTAGRFLLTGSASPASSPTHSGAGRIVSVRMRPMTLAERAIEVPTVSLAGLMTGRRDKLEGSTTIDAERYAAEILASGFPALRGLSERVVRAELDGYLERVLDHDIEDSGRSIRRRATLLRWLQAYAAAISTTTSLEKIRAAASPSSHDVPARSTVGRYVEALQALWLLEPIPGWRPTANRLARLTERPKHQLADPALAARLLGVTSADLLHGAPSLSASQRHTTLFGALFESLVTADVRVYAQASEGRVYHFRDMGGEHEVDLIIEGFGGRVVALEVKLAHSITDADVRHLRWLRDRIGDLLLDAVVVTTGGDAYRRQDGIAVVPAALLGP